MTMVKSESCARAEYIDIDRIRHTSMKGTTVPTT